VLDASVTRRQLSLGVIDIISGWPELLWIESTIDMFIQPKSKAQELKSAGLIAKYDLNGFTSDPCSEGDVIVDSAGNYFGVHEVDETWILNSFMYRTCELVKQEMHADRPATYGSDAWASDPRYLLKVWLRTNMTGTNITEDDGVTPAEVLYQFGEPDYPLPKMFLAPKNVDLIVSVCTPEMQNLLGPDYYPLGYTSRVPIKFYAVNKTGITADNLLSKVEAELRSTLETHPIGLRRSLQRQKTGDRTTTNQTVNEVDFILTCTDVATVTRFATNNVTYYALAALGAEDATTGIYTVSYAAGSTMQMSVVPKSTGQLLTTLGVHCKYDAVGITNTLVTEGSQIDAPDGKRYLIQSVTPYYAASTLLNYEVGLTKIDLT